ncbi:MAG: sigma-70 family RNA polymerase sigma factor [Propionicimonas sp.]|nr:sigma-70 family RNA polymerase sigma factor [Propionicimonas sp.]
MHRFPDLPPLFTAQEESRLARTIEAGVLAGAALADNTGPVGASPAELQALVAEGQQAWQHFLLVNLRLVGNLVRRAEGHGGVEADELFQEGFLALARAVQGYDHTRGRFSTYATSVVWQHLVEVTSSRDGRLGIPSRRAVELRRAQLLADTLGQERGREVSLAEVADALGTSVERTRRLLGHRVQASLDQAAVARWADEGSSQDFDTGVDADRIAADLARLPGQEREALRLRFGFADGRCHSYRDLAAELDTSISSARRICEHALETLRSWHAEAWQADLAS